MKEFIYILHATLWSSCRYMVIKGFKKYLNHLTHSIETDYNNIGKPTLVMVFVINLNMEYTILS